MSAFDVSVLVSSVTVHCDFLARTTSRCRRAYILPLLFLSFFWRLIYEVTERISTKPGHLFTYDCYLRNLVQTSPAFTSTVWGSNNAFWDRLWTLTNMFLQRNIISTIGKKPVYLQGLPYMRLKLDSLWYRHGWERLASFCPPPKFLHWVTCQPYRMVVRLYNRQQANFGTCNVVAWV